MDKRRFRAPSPALIISLIALFVALGGTTYAATSVPANSVGTKQLKRNAVTGAKIKDATITSAKINTNGLTVPDATSLGGHPSTFYAPKTLPSGQSETGIWMAHTDNSSAYDTVAFTTPLASSLDRAHVAYLTKGTTNSHCLGIGKAAPGYLCIYEALDHSLNFSTVYTHSGTQGADAYGLVIAMQTPQGITGGDAWGAWTATAP